MLHLRRNTYASRLIVPATLRRVLGRREITKSLRTSNLRLAKRRAAAWEAHVFHLFAALGQSKSSMTRDEIDQLTQRYLVASFEGVEDVLALDWSPGGLDEYSFQLNEQCHALTGALAHGDLAAALPLVEEMAPQANDHEKRLLARRFLEIQLKSAIATLKALSGEPLELPVRPESTAGITKEATASPSTPRVSEVARLYAEERIARGNWSSKTAGQSEKIYELIADLLGNKEIGTVTKADVRQLGLDIAMLPANSSKRVPGKTAREILELGLPEDRFPRLKPRSVNKHYQQVRSLFAWAAEHDYIPSDPSQVLRDVEEGRAQDARSDLSDQDVALLFSYLPSVATEPYRLWIPRIMALTGCRMGEAAQLQPKDIRQEGAIWVIDINADHPEKDVKNSNAIRLVPIHPTLLSLGLLEFAQASTDEFLFPQRVRFTDSPNRGNVDRLSKQLNRWLDAAGVADPKKTFQSFRGTMATRLKNLNIPEYQISEILGHENDNITSGRYGKRSQLAPLHAAISQVSLPVS